MGEVLLARGLEARGVTAEVASAGFLTEDRPPPDEVVELMADRGIDVSGHRSRIVTPELLEEADLVVGMAREHVRDAAVEAPGCFGRTFTLKELVRRGTEAGGVAPGESVDAWLARVGADRTPAQLLGAAADDDVTDPIGRRQRVYRRVADEIEVLTDQLVGLLAP